MYNVQITPQYFIHFTRVAERVSSRLAMLLAASSRACRPTARWARQMCVVNAGSDLTVSRAIAQDKCTVLYFTASW
eukprot:scaffold35116_cov37-Tisochrysis_lutea.AAC.1